MQEEFLHYIWKYQKFDSLNLITTNKQEVVIHSVGQHNYNSGPDFFNAQITIENQRWAGNVEIHLNSSDWYAHNHEKDKNYDNVVLHIVWEHDIEVFRKDNSSIPTIELKERISKSTLSNYQDLFLKKGKWINCETEFHSVDDFTITNWLERLYFERLERKSKLIDELLLSLKNDWEAVLFKMLSKNFGLKVNGDAFSSMANSFDYSIVRKQQFNVMSLEALLFGQANLLEEDCQDTYFLELKELYKFLKQKFQLKNDAIIPVQFFRLRPYNFPTIRLSQLASLYYKHKQVFSKIIEAKTLDEYYDLFSVSTSSYWESHYTFNKLSRQKKKTLSKAFINLLLINTIIPLKFSHAKSLSNTINDELIALMNAIKSEENSIIKKFNQLKPVATSALKSQALLELKNEYCDKNKCLQCSIGSLLLMRND